MSELVLVLGGTRSGKSEFAEKYVLHAGAVPAYVATAEIFDKEMAERVRLHKQRRQRRWLNFEAPYDAAPVLREAGEKADCILFDCLTIYLSNMLYGKQPLTGTTADKGVAVFAEMEKLLAAAKESGKTVVFVTDDVSGGIVPANPVAREFRDISGWVNQQVGKAADRVFYVVAGQAVDIKRLAFRFEDEKS